MITTETLTLNAEQVRLMNLPLSGTPAIVWTLDEGLADPKYHINVFDGDVLTFIRMYGEIHVFANWGESIANGNIALHYCGDRSTWRKEKGYE